LQPRLSSCFWAKVDGNHGLRGTTHFRGDSSAAGPATGCLDSSAIAVRSSTAPRPETWTWRETGITNTLSGRVAERPGHRLPTGGRRHRRIRRRDRLPVRHLRQNVSNVIHTIINGELCVLQ
jgi:hypothetical protein